MLFLPSFIGSASAGADLQSVPFTTLLAPVYNWCLITIKKARITDPHQRLEISAGADLQSVLLDVSGYI